MRRKEIAWGILGVMAVLLVIGLARLFELRQTSGDLHPPYSSLRADPLGLKALYLALDDLGLETRRNYRPWNWVKVEPKTTWIFASLKRRVFLWQWPRDRSIIESIPKQGGRLVIAFERELPALILPRSQLTNYVSTSTNNLTHPSHSWSKRWGFEFATHPLAHKGDLELGPVNAHRVDAPPNWPEKLPWRSILGFTNVSPEWRVLYSVGKHPVIMERPLGAGSIVLLSDNYLLSNQALRFERVSPLLAWLIGTPRLVVFDEAHLGVVEKPSMGQLFREYRLQGVVAVSLLLVVLYIWQNSFPLVPPASHGSGSHNAPVLGQDIMTGMVQLLRRGIPPRRLLRVCLDQWKTTAGGKADAALIAAMEEQVRDFETTPARKANTLKTFEALARIASQKRRGRSTPTKTTP